CVAGPSTASATSPPTWASSRKWYGSTTRIMAGSGPPLLIGQCCGTASGPCHNGLASQHTCCSTVSRPCHNGFGSRQSLHLPGQPGGKGADDWPPAVAGVGRGVHLAAGGAEIDAALVERIGGHRVAQDVYVAVLLRQALRERLPFVSARA